MTPEAYRPRPSRVTTPAVDRLPRWVLLLFCAAWALPGWWGRDPWRGADITAYALMSGMAEGRLSWWAPALGGQAVEVDRLAHWVGAAGILALTPLVEASSAARLPFALMLMGTLALVWYATYHWARTPAAQPLPLAFGGDALPRDYAMALADGAALALVATLGLLDLGHQTTPELIQLFAVAALLWAVARSATAPRRATLGAVGSLCLLAASGAPSMALLLGLSIALACLVEEGQPLRKLVLPLFVGSALAGLVGLGLDSWRWHLTGIASLADGRALARLWAWFLWPAWPLVLWTLWQWRRQWRSRHVLVPTLASALALTACVAMGRSDRVLLLALPATAVLAAFALPTLRRGAAAAIDWFSMALFSATALFLWVMYMAMQTGFPAKPAANVAKLAPSFEAILQVPALVLATFATVAWLALVRWRTGRHRHALWKSMMLPAGGVALCWTLLMTLWMPLIDHDRSPRLLVEQIRSEIPPQACVWAPDLPAHLVASLETLGRLQVDARTTPASTCPVRLTASRSGEPPGVDGWTRVATFSRPTDRRDQVSLHRRSEPPAQDVQPPAWPVQAPAPRP